MTVEGFLACAIRVYEEEGGSLAASPGLASTLDDGLDLPGVVLIR